MPVLALELADRGVLRVGARRDDVGDRREVEIDPRLQQLRPHRVGFLLERRDGVMAPCSSADGITSNPGPGQSLDLAALLVGRDEEPHPTRGRWVASACTASVMARTGRTPMAVWVVNVIDPKWIRPRWHRARWRRVGP